MTRETRLLRSGLERLVCSAVFSILVVGVSACASRPPQPFVPPVDPAQIVEQNARDALDTFASDADVPALRQFEIAIATATTRADLVTNWDALPRLKAWGNDFLDRHVFEKATAEARWPPNLPAAATEAAFATGVRAAIKAFLATKAP